MDGRQWIAWTAVLIAISGCARRPQSDVRPQPAPTAVFWNRAPLQPNAFAPLPLGSIKPRGWLRNQLEIQASGLSGHLDEFWPDLGPDSGWLGGTGEAWERGPYYLDGLVPLAWLLEDERLIAKARKWVDWTLNNQRPNGAIGPDPARGRYAAPWQAEDWWPNMIMLKALTQFQEATGDERVIPVMSRYFRYHLAEADKRPLIRWAQMRWAEEILTAILIFGPLPAPSHEARDIASLSQPSPRFPRRLALVAWPPKSGALEPHQFMTVPPDVYTLLPPATEASLLQICNHCA